MEKVIDSLLEVMQGEWDEVVLGQFLCDVYALGYQDGQKDKDPETNQLFLLLSPAMNCDVVQDYILNSLEAEDEDFELEDDPDSEELENF